MKCMIAIAVLGTAATLAGCAIQPNVRQQQVESGLRALTQGQSTREDVVKQLGKPDREIVFERMHEEVWEYRYPTTTWHILLEVSFSTETGKLKQYTSRPDPAFHDSAWSSGY